MTVPVLNVTLYERDARFILESLEALEKQWRHINQTSTDEDVQAEYGMDAAVLQMTREEFEDAAVKVFGPGIKNFSRVPFRPPFDGSSNEDGN